MQCIPIPVSKKETMNRIIKVDEEYEKCSEKSDDLIEYAICIGRVEEDFYHYIGEEVYPYNSEFRCADTSLFGAASTVKVSVIAMVATLLFALFF